MRKITASNDQPHAINERGGPGEREEREGEGHHGTRIIRTPRVIKGGVGQDGMPWPLGEGERRGRRRRHGHATYCLLARMHAHKAKRVYLSGWAY